jgi:pilus assembly protein Flp/PilA
MNTLANIAGRFRQEEDGAALIEYTVLLGIITVAVIGTIVLVGGWVSTQWTTLNTKLVAVSG